MSHHISGLIRQLYRYFLTLCELSLKIPWFLLPEAGERVPEGPMRGLELPAIKINRILLVLFPEYWAVSKREKDALYLTLRNALNP